MQIPGQLRLAGVVPEIVRRLRAYQPGIRCSGNNVSEKSKRLNNELEVPDKNSKFKLQFQFKPSKPAKQSLLKNNSYVSLNKENHSNKYCELVTTLETLKNEKNFYLQYPS